MSKVANSHHLYQYTKSVDTQQSYEQLENFYNQERLSYQNQQHNVPDSNHLPPMQGTKEVQNCFRCLSAKSVHKCIDCHMFHYCGECFKIIHQGKKLQGHRIENLQTELLHQNRRQSNPRIIELQGLDKGSQKFENIRNCIFYKENSYYTNMRNLIIQTGVKYEFILTKNEEFIDCVKRKWENIEKHIQKQFVKIRQAINDQLNLILNTLKMKSEQEIQNTKRLQKINQEIIQFKKCISKSKQVEVESNLSLAQEMLRKIKRISDQIQNFQTNKVKSIDLTVSKEIFDEFRSLLSKMDFKNILQKSKQNNTNPLIVKQNQNMKLSCILINKELNKGANKQKNRSLANHSKNGEKLKIKKPNDVNDSFLSIIEDKNQCKKIKKIKSETHIPYDIPTNSISSKKNKGVGEGLTKRFK